MSSGEAASLVALGEAYRQAGDRGSAISLFRQAVARDPQGEEAYAAMAEVYLTLAQTGAAAEAVKAGLRRRPRSMRLWLVMIEVLERQARPLEALEAARHLGQLHPDGVRGLRVHAALAISTGRYLEALAVCRRLEALTRQTPDDTLDETRRSLNHWARTRIAALRVLNGTLDAARNAEDGSATAVRRALSSAP